MPQISQRGTLMPASPIRKLVPLADDAKARGIHVYHLNIGQPDLPTPQAALDAIRNIDRTVLEYSPSQGYQSYREKLVGYYKKYDINLSADDIIITTGGSEAVLFAFLSCLNPGDEIIVPEPAYANYMAFAISAGAVIRTVTTTIEEGFSLPKVEKFEELINERTKAILICNPNNPTGYLYTRREMNQIRDIVKKYDLYLFSDEVYREFIYTGSPYISAMHLEGIEQNVVLIDSVSKRYSECGIRIGALITKNEAVRKISTVLNQCDFGSVGSGVLSLQLDTPIHTGIHIPASPLMITLIKLAQERDCIHQYHPVEFISARVSICIGTIVKRIIVTKAHTQNLCIPGHELQGICPAIVTF